MILKDHPFISERICNSLQQTLEMKKSNGYRNEASDLIPSETVYREGNMLEKCQKMDF